MCGKKSARSDEAENEHPKKKKKKKKKNAYMYCTNGIDKVIERVCKETLRIRNAVLLEIKSICKGLPEVKGLHRRGYGVLKI